MRDRPLRAPHGVTQMRFGSVRAPLIHIHYPQDLYF